MEAEACLNLPPIRLPFASAKSDFNRLSAYLLPAKSDLKRLSAFNGGGGPGSGNMKFSSLGSGSYLSFRPLLARVSTPLFFVRRFLAVVARFMACWALSSSTPPLKLPRHGF